MALPVRSLPLAACLGVMHANPHPESPRWKPGDRVTVDAASAALPVRSLPLAACMAPPAQKTPGVNRRIELGCTTLTPPPKSVWGVYAIDSMARPADNTY